MQKITYAIKIAVCRLLNQVILFWCGSAVRFCTFHLQDSQQTIFLSFNDSVKREKLTRNISFTNTQIHKYTHLHTHTHKHTNTHAHTHTHAHAQKTRTHVHTTLTYMYAHPYKSAHMLIHEHTHAYTRTDTRAHMHQNVYSFNY